MNKQEYISFIEKTIKNKHLLPVQEIYFNCIHNKEYADHLLEKLTQLRERAVMEVIFDFNTFEGYTYKIKMIPRYEINLERRTSQQELLKEDSSVVELSAKIFRRATLRGYKESLMRIVCLFIMNKIDNDDFMSITNSLSIELANLLLDLTQFRNIPEGEELKNAILMWKLSS